MKTITVKSNDQAAGTRRFRFPFSTTELAIFVVVLSALLIAGFYILAPKRALDSVADTRRRNDVQRIYDGITLYLIDNGGDAPSYAGGKDIPQVATTDILEVGVPVDELDNFVPKYMSAIPRDPDGTSYKIGVLANGRVAIAASLTIGETYIVSESNPSVIQRSTNNDSDESEGQDTLPGGTPTEDFSD